MPSKTKIYLKSKAEESISYWQNGISFADLTPTPKVISILEVSGNIKFASLSCHYDYLAVAIWTEEDTTETLYVVHLKDERVEKVTSFPNQINVMRFIPCQEDALIVSSQCDIYCFSIKNRESKTLKGHLYFPENISMRKGSHLMITISRSEVFIWSWPECLVPKISKLKYKTHIIQAGHLYESKLIFVAYESGLVLLWDEEVKKKEKISPPEGISMNFRSFSLSSDGEWLIGTGTQALMVVYSMNYLRVNQVVQLSHIDSPLGIYEVTFLPYIHPQYPKCILIQTSRSIIIADFTNFSVIKVLNSNRYSIRKAQISEDGFLLGITYGNGVLKIYTLLSFFPQPPSTLKLSDRPQKEVKFSIMEVRKPKARKSVEPLFSSSKWKEILNEFGEYPSKYRKHIWISLMKLPRNYSVLNDLLIKERRYKFENLQNIFTTEDSHIVSSLKGVLQLLCVWSPFLAKLEFLPNFLLPFVKVFDGNILLSFEASVFIFLNWFRFLLNTQPSTPSIVTELVKQLLSENNSLLLSHLKKLETNIEEIVWTLLSSGFREVFNEEDWAIIWDHIISKPNSYIIAFCASLVVQLKPAMLKCSQRTVLLSVLHEETFLPLRLYLKRAETFHKNMVLESLRTKIDEVIILPKGSLPVFDIRSSDLKSILNLSNRNGRYHSFGPLNKDFYSSHPDDPLSIYAKDTTTNSREGALETSVLRRKEDECLKNIKNVRTKILNRPIT